MTVPEWAGFNSVWQANVIQFLSSHKKYQVFQWEFGPTLLDHLQRAKESEGLDYLKRGLKITYSASPVISSIVYFSTRSLAMTTFSGVGAMLLGALITVAIDSKKIKRVDERLSLEDCFELLKALEKMPQYWWWPWSNPIGKTRITEKEYNRVLKSKGVPLFFRLFYALFTNIRLHKICVLRDVYLYNYQKLNEEKMPKIDCDLFKKIRHFFTFPRLGDGLYSLNRLDWIPLYLDKSLQGVRDGEKTIEDHNRCFNYEMQKINQVALLDVLEKTLLINDLKEGLEQIHHYAVNQQFGEENIVFYRLFENVILKNISGQNFLEMIDVLEKKELSRMSYWKEELLMKERNAYLDCAKTCLETLNHLQKKESADVDINRRFQKSYQKYIDVYRNQWVIKLKELNERCAADRRLEGLEEKVSRELRKSNAQYCILFENQHKLEEADQIFVQPIVEYFYLMNLYFDFFSIIDREKIDWSKKETIDEKTKEEVERLPRQELLRSARKTLLEIEKGQKEELETLLLFKLERAKNLLEETFKSEETLLEKEANKIERIRQTLRSRQQVIQGGEKEGTELIKREKWLMIFRLEDENAVSLEKALFSLNRMDGLLIDLDISLKRVKNGTQTLEEHNEVFNENLRKIRRLSLACHPDKQNKSANTDTNALQQLIYDVMEALKQIHNNVLIKYTQVIERRLVYRLFRKDSIKEILNGNALKMDHIAVKTRLDDIAFWEKEQLIRGRNAYLNDARKCLEDLKALPQDKEIIQEIRKAFVENNQKYKDVYQNRWIKNLKNLKEEIARTEELCVLQQEVNEVLKESERQFQFLSKRNLELVEGDQTVIQPIVEYSFLIEMYFDFLEIGGKKRPNNTDPSLITHEERQVIETLSRQALLKSAQESYHELGDALGKTKVERKKIEELENVLLFKLEKIKSFLEKEFKIKETLIQKEKREEKEKKQALLTLYKRIEEDRKATKEAKKELRKAKEELRKAKEEAEKSHLEKVAVKCLFRKIRRLDDELKEAIEGEEDKIISAAISGGEGPIKEYIEAVIEGIKGNREKILKEKTIPDEILEKEIKRFLNQKSG